MPSRYHQPTHPTRPLQAATLVLLAVCVTLSSPVLAETKSCPALLTDNECLQYQHQLDEVGSQDQRARVEQDYRRMVEERRQLCRHPDPTDQPRLRQSLVQAGLPAELFKP
jgi:hypothetical protein